MRLIALVKLLWDPRTSWWALTTLAIAIVFIGGLIGESWGLAAAAGLLTAVGIFMTRKRLGR